jgi:bifunctional non-homologous end joining protein LigD
MAARDRIIARKDGPRVRLYSRPGNDLTRRFPLIVDALARLRSRSWRSCHHGANERVFLYAFDLIELNGDDLRRDPLEVRKATLASVLAKAAPGMRFNEHIEGDGPTVFAHACKLGLEGIVSKRKGSTYRSGRSPDWLKMKNPSAAAATREAEEDWSKSRQGHASVFARARREIAPCLGRMGRYEGRSTGRLRASSQGVEGRILPRRQGER